MPKNLHPEETVLHAAADTNMFVLHPRLGLCHNDH